MASLSKSMEAFIREILGQVHPDMEIDPEALTQIQSIVNSLIASSEHLNLEQWIDSHFVGELAKHAREEAYKAQPNQSTMAAFPSFTPQKAATIEYIVAEILELAGNHRRKEDIEREGEEPELIILSDVLSAIYEDEELYQSLKNYIPLFPFGFAQKYKKFKIPKDNIDYTGDASDEYKEGLRDVLTALINYYADNFPLNTLWDYQYKVGNFIEDQAFAQNNYQTKGLNLKKLMDAVYNNPQISNIPWRDVFVKALTK